MQVKNLVFTTAAYAAMFSSVGFLLLITTKIIG